MPFGVENLNVLEGRVHYVVGDVSVAADVERLFAEAEQRHGKVDILINNAAVYPKVLFLESDMDDWAKALEINVVGMARCCHHALPGMLERGYGRILNLGSFAWKGPIPTEEYRPVEYIAPRVVERQNVDSPVQTGIKAIDAMVPIGRGQRELIVGDRQTLVVDSVIPAIMAVIYLLVLLYFKAIGGYRALRIEEDEEH